MRALFVKAFPEAETALTYDNMAEAIAAFERTLITKDRFDDFQRGDDEALSDLELKGLETFTGIGCTTCHTGPLLGGHVSESRSGQSIRKFQRSRARSRHQRRR